MMLKSYGTFHLCKRNLLKKSLEVEVTFGYSPLVNEKVDFRSGKRSPTLARDGQKEVGEQANMVINDV